MAPSFRSYGISRSQMHPTSFGGLVYWQSASD